MCSAPVGEKKVDLKYKALLVLKGGAIFCYFGVVSHATSRYNVPWYERLNRLLCSATIHFFVVSILKKKSWKKKIGSFVCALKAGKTKR